MTVTKNKMFYKKTIRLKLGTRLAITTASSSGTYTASNFTYTPLRRREPAYGQLCLCSGAISMHYTFMNTLLFKHLFTTDNQVRKGTHCAIIVKTQIEGAFIITPKILGL